MYIVLYRSTTVVTRSPSSIGNYLESFVTLFGFLTSGRGAWVSRSVNKQTPRARTNIGALIIRIGFCGYILL